MSKEALAKGERLFAARFGDRSMMRHWWVPGRIELLGKHIDYIGGRSLVTAVDRGFHILARPRSDRKIHLLDARSTQSWIGTLDRDAAQTPGRWTDYVVSVVRRLSRDFPEATHGMDAVLSSSLPSASGLSSSSALVIATLLPLVAFNSLDETDVWQQFLLGDALGGYAGAIENGRAFGPFQADFGVGTQGGSQDHTAILGCKAGMISQFRYLPVARERDIAVPEDWAFAVASSGVSASKTGSAQEQYNRLSSDAATLLTAWNAASGDTAVSLLDVLSVDRSREDELRAILASHPRVDGLIKRLAQFREECLELIPAAADAIEAGDGSSLGPLVARSHELARTVLRNQVEETESLTSSASELGAVATSPFGAGFGGSVWALFQADEAAGMVRRWRDRYTAKYPAVAHRSEFFLTQPTSGAGELTD